MTGMASFVIENEVLDFVGNSVAGQRQNEQPEVLFSRKFLSRMTLHILNTGLCGKINSDCPVAKRNIDD